MWKRLSLFKRPRVVIPLLFIALVAGLAYLIIKNMSAPADGSIEQTPPAKAEVVDPYAQPGTYKGKYITFRYPAHFKTVPSKLSGSYLEVASYSSIDISGKQISVGVSRGSFDTESSIIYRRQHKNLYRENSSNLGLEFTKLDGTEDTFFLEHGGLIASVSATAPYNNQAGDAVFVASSLKWR
jgi:hypothetical protein